MKSAMLALKSWLAIAQTRVDQFVNDDEDLR